MKTILLFFLFASLAGTAQSFVLPTIPDELNSEHERVKYLTLHYWDNYDFENPSVFIEGDIILNYFSCLREVPCLISNKSIQQTLERSSISNQIFSLFIDAYRIYLFNPESFFCDYDKYLAVDEFVLGNERISVSKKSEFELERTIIYTNRIGNKASNFIVTNKNNNPIELYDIESEYLLVFFHNPNCSICMDTKEMLSTSEIIKNMSEEGKLKVFSVCPYDDYNSWMATEYPEQWLNGFDKEQRINKNHLYYFLESSSLYLLDKDKIILKKDTRFDLLEAYLSNLM